MASGWWSNSIDWSRNRDHEGRLSGKTGAPSPIHPGLSEEPMNLCRLLAFGLFLILVPATVFCICMMLIMFYPDSMRLMDMRPH